MQNITVLPRFYDGYLFSKMDEINPAKYYPESIASRNKWMQDKIGEICLQEKTHTASHHQKCILCHLNDLTATTIDEILSIIPLGRNELNMHFFVFWCVLLWLNISCYGFIWYDTLSILLINSLLWRHNGRGSVSNHQRHDCLLNRLFRRRSKKTARLRVTGLCAENSPGTGEFQAQMASNAENVSI